MVHDLRGMFAFAIWDAARAELFLARDPYGIKPLYYADDGWTVRFASQVKALCAGGSISRDPDPAGWVGFYLFGSVPEPLTTYSAIRQLPAGGYLYVGRLGPREPRRYHSIASAYCAAESTSRHHAEHREAIRDALLDSVRHHLVADVPVGAFLSAGVDSGALVGLMRDAGQSNIQTVTVNFEEFRGTQEDEAPLAAEVARAYGTCHVTRTVTEREFRADLPRILAAMDQPTIDGVNTWFVSKAAHELGLKVAISGLGGDELFGGYSSFREVPRWVRWLAVPSRVPLLGRTLRRAAVAMGAERMGANPKAAGLVEFGGSYAGAYLLRRGLFMPWELEQLLDGDIVREGLRRLEPLRAIGAALRPRPVRPFSRVATLESALYMRNQLLRDTDWAAMAHGLEVRVPLVDSVLLDRISPLTASGLVGPGKAALAASPRIPLPTAITNRAKTGFLTPISSWLQREATPRPFKHIPSLASVHCPWARQWAYSVAAT
jgi:asparagine synthase (glutamine-hydrolysing)